MMTEGREIPQTLTVKIGDQSYYMGRTEFMEGLSVAEVMVPVGIYAIEKNREAILRYEHLSPEETMQRKAEYEADGWTVYYNCPKNV